MLGREGGVGEVGSAKHKFFLHHGRVYHQSVRDGAKEVFAD